MTPDESGDAAQTVLRIAALARLDIDAGEARVLGAQFQRILEHFRVLAELDVEGVPPMTGATLVEDVTRADEPRPSWERGRILAPAPDERDGFLGVPKTIGGAP